MAEKKDLPNGLELVMEKHLWVKSSYRSSVDFDEILPGDLLIYRGDDLKYYFVHQRSRDSISGWHFGGLDNSGSGGWGHDYESFVENQSQVDKVAPSLVETILRFYNVEKCILKAFQTEDAKIE